MGQILLPENIPSLVRASGTSLTLAPTSNGQSTRLTIGGQQFALSATLTLTTSGTGANGLDAGALGAIQLWYVYAVVNQSSFAVALVASQTAPSAGPAMPSGYGTAYKLVGAFYTDGSSTVGSTVPITGTATTSWMSYTPVCSWVTNSTPSGSWRRNGDSVEIKDSVTLTGAPNATGLTFTPPAGLTPDSARFPVGGSTGDIPVGVWQGYRSGPLAQYGGVVAFNGSNALMGLINGASGGSGNYLVGATAPVTWGSGDRVAYRGLLPITGWKETLL